MKKTLLLLSLLAIAGLSACDDDDSTTSPSDSGGLVGTWGHSMTMEGLGTVNETVVVKSDSSFVLSVVNAANDSVRYAAGRWRAADSILTMTGQTCKELSAEGLYASAPCGAPDVFKYWVTGNALYLVDQTVTSPDTMTFTRR